MGAIESLQTSVNKLETSVNKLQIQSYLFGVLLGLWDGDLTIRGDRNGHRIEVRGLDGGDALYQAEIYTREHSEDSTEQHFFYTAEEMALFVWQYVNTKYWVEWRL